MKRIFLFLMVCFVTSTVKSQAIEDLYVSSTGWASWTGICFSEFKVCIDGQLEFETEHPYYQYNVDGFVEGDVHNIKVAPIVDGNVGDFCSFDWVYTSCEHYEGFAEAPRGEWQGNDIVLSWTLPRSQVGVGTHVGELVGTFIFLDGEFLTYLLENTETFTHRDQPEVEHEYALRIVYNGDYEDFSFSAMSCEEYVTMPDPTMVTEVADDSFMVYPNPTSDAVTLCCKEMQCVKVFNSEGQMMRSIEVDGDKLILDVSAIASGLYVIQIICRDAKIMSQKVTINK